MTLSSLLIFFIILFFLVVIHELGHFLFAKYLKVRVDEFAFGFPPRLFFKKVGDTVYSFNTIPLGGYVKIFGENGEGGDHKNSFKNKNAYAKILILSAGVFFNILGAIFLFAIALSIGTNLQLTQEDLQTFKGSKQLIITSINEKSSLFGTGIKLGDEIVMLQAMDKQELNLNSVTAREFVQNYNNSEILIYYKNPENIIKSVTAIPKSGIVDDKKVLGVEFTDVAFQKYSFFEALPKAVNMTISQLVYIFVSLYDLVKNLIFSNAKVEDNLSGPIGLAVMTAKVSEKGLDQIYIFAGMLSLSLAAFNILPIPALDGGRIVFVLFEAITKRKIKASTEQIFHGLGFLLLILLMVFVSYFDIVKAF